MEHLNEKDRLLWKQAKKRVDFRRHLFTYMIVNGLVWALWLFGWLGGESPAENGGTIRHYQLPWPIFMTVGWGIGLAFDFYSAYFGNSVSAVEKEYEKLKNAGR